MTDEYDESEDEVTRAHRILWDIQRGVKKEDSRYVSSEEHAAMWDETAKWLSELKPGEIPITGEYMWREDD